jgi:hypothetical protein
MVRNDRPLHPQRRSPCKHHARSSPAANVTQINILRQKYADENIFRFFEKRRVVVLRLPKCEGHRFSGRVDAGVTSQKSPSDYNCLHPEDGPIVQSMAQEPSGREQLSSIHPSIVGPASPLPWDIRVTSEIGSGYVGPRGCGHATWSVSGRPRSSATGRCLRPKTACASARP